jgi:hypothetical protein
MLKDKKILVTGGTWRRARVHGCSGVFDGAK